MRDQVTPSLIRSTAYLSANEDRAEIDQLFVLLEQVNERVVADDWFKQNDFYDLQQQTNLLGGDVFYSCPVGPLGG